MIKLLHWIALLFLLTNSLFSQQVKINYFEESPPGKDPKVFAPGFICKDNRIEGRGAFSPDGKQFYFTVSDISFRKQKILYTEFKNNQWTKPDTAIFSKKYANYEPFFSSDCQKLFFTSNRNPDTLGNHKDIYFVTRIGDSWSEPQIIDSPINSLHTEVFFSQVKNGNIYFSSDRSKGKGLYEIYMALKQPNDSFIVKNIGKRINKHYWDADPCIAPDESFIIFSVVRVLKFFNKTDLYITFKDGNNWTKPKSLGKLINTKANEYAPFLSPDNKYLFFTRLGEGNMGDIYWVDLSEIMKLKKNK
jgi:Tol biopolymer transport system component